MASKGAARVALWGRRIALWAAGVVFAFAVANLALTTVFLARRHQMERIASDAHRLALSGERADAANAERKFRVLYTNRLEPSPTADQLRQFFERQLAVGGPLVLDQVLTDYIVARWDRLDGRTLPAGVYVGARAIGPDTAPLSWVTKYLGHYAFYPRHGYVLVVPDASSGAPPVEFSASRASDFLDDPSSPHQLFIRPEPFQPGAYDFPGRGQAIHELFRISDDPSKVDGALAQLRSLASGLRMTDARYKLFRQNSNTVLGCMLRQSTIPRDHFDRLTRNPLVRLRLLAIDRPLWSHPSDRNPKARC